VSAEIVEGLEKGRSSPGDLDGALYSEGSPTPHRSLMKEKGFVCPNCFI